MLRKIQEEHKEWERNNFGKQPAYRSLLGMTEELGELAHAHLKMEQGIRNHENHDEAAKDSIADLIIFAMGYCNAKGYDLEKILQETWDQVKQRDWKKNPDTAHQEK